MDIDDIITGIDIKIGQMTQEKSFGDQKIIAVQRKINEAKDTFKEAFTYFKEFKTNEKPKNVLVKLSQNHRVENIFKSEKKPNEDIAFMSFSQNDSATPYKMVDSHIYADGKNFSPNQKFKI